MSFDLIKQAAAAGHLLVDETFIFQTLAQSCNEPLGIAASSAGCSDIVSEGSGIVHVCMRLFYPA